MRHACVCLIKVTVTLSKSSDFKVRHPNAIEPESIEMHQTVKVRYCFSVFTITPHFESVKYPYCYQCTSMVGVNCDQMARWIKMPLGMGAVLGHCVTRESGSPNIVVLCSLQIFAHIGIAETVGFIWAILVSLFLKIAVTLKLPDDIRKIYILLDSWVNCELQLSRLSWFFNWSCLQPGLNYVRRGCYCYGGIHASHWPVNSV